MTGGRRGNIDGIDVRIVNQFLSIRVPTRNAVTFGIATRFALVTTHYSHYTRPLNFGKSRAAFLLSHLTASDEAPLQYFHNRVQRYKIFLNS